MLALCLCLLGQLRFEETVSPPVAFASPRPQARPDAYAAWRGHDGSWGPPRPSGSVPEAMLAVPRFRWRAEDGTVWEHPDRATLRLHVIDRNAALRRRAARVQVPPTYFTPIVSPSYAAPRASPWPAAAFCTPGGT